MTIPSRCRKLLGLLLVPVLGSLVGCNLRDYEDRMQQAQALLKQQDEEYRVLDGPIEIPPYPNSGSADIFLRLPLGINPQPDNPQKPVSGLLFQYLRKQQPAPGAQPGQQPMQPGMGQNPNPPGAAPTVPVIPTATTLLDVFLAYRSGSDKPLAGLLDEVQRLYPPATGKVEKKTRKFRPIGREPYDLNLIEYSDLQYSYVIVSTSGALSQVVVLYRLEKGKQAASQSVLDLSLQTLAVDEVAQKTRTVFFNDFARRPPR